MKIQDGTYAAKPAKAQIYLASSGSLMLCVEFNIVDEDGNEFQNDNGYPLSYRKWFALVSKDGAVNTATVDRIKEWAAGFEPQSIDDFYDYFTANDFEKIRALEVDVVLKTEAIKDGEKKGQLAQGIAFVNAKGGHGSWKMNLPSGAVDDKAAIAAKFGAKFRAAFAAKPKTVAASTAPAKAAAPAAPARKPNPARPAAPAKVETATVEDVWGAYLSSLPADTSEDDRDAGWFKLLDDNGLGSKDQDQITPAEWGTLKAKIGK